MKLKEYANKKILESKKNTKKLNWKNYKINSFLNKDSVILDIGCGPANFTDLYGIDKNKYFGIDYNDFFVENGIKNGLNLLKIDLSKENLPYEDNKFDLIYCSHVIEHLETDRQINLFFEISRILKAGGILIMFAPTPYHWYFWDDPTHKRPVTHGSLSQLANDVGLNIIESRYSLFKKFPNHLQRFLRLPPFRFFLWKTYLIAKK